jgi:DNA modification methylase
MWDNLFSMLSADAKVSLAKGDGNATFEAMHIELDKVWKELYRVLKPGSFACINIGDATRTIGGRFQLYPNHARIVSAFRQIGFDTLPVILWRKQTNAPNKFMGSGMLPAGAYVTLEHEYILVFRKGAKRDFGSTSEKEARMCSSFFWEERNKWFSDVWDFKGTTQGMNNVELRRRSAAFPLELAYRLINMYSLYGETVLDPFLGTGTTALAAIACARNSVGVEIEKEFCSLILDQEKEFVQAANEILSARILAHNAFVKARRISNGGLKYVNSYHGFPVMTRQEVGIRLHRIVDIHIAGETETAAEYESVGRLADNESSSREIATAKKVGSHQLFLGF